MVLIMAFIDQEILPQSYSLWCCIMSCIFQYYSLAEAAKAQGVVVVIDVLRAFTTVAFAFHAGVKRILPVSGIEEAFLLKQRFPKVLIMGEDHGLQVPGFDFGNSPADIARAEIVGKTLIQRTTAGTQGIIRAENASKLIAASFVCADATANYLQSTRANVISFIITGTSYGRDGDEDLACAEYITALVRQEHIEPDAYLARVGSSSAGHVFLDEHQLFMHPDDLRLCLQVNEFKFYMPIIKDGDLLVMQQEFGVI